MFERLSKKGVLTTINWREIAKVEIASNERFYSYWNSNKMRYTYGGKGCGPNGKLENPRRYRYCYRLKPTIQLLSNRIERRRQL